MSARGHPSTMQRVVATVAANTTARSQPQLKKKCRTASHCKKLDENKHNPKRRRVKHPDDSEEARVETEGSHSPSCDSAHNSNNAENLTAGNILPLHMTRPRRFSQATCDLVTEGVRLICVRTVDKLQTLFYFHPLFKLKKYAWEGLALDLEVGVLKPKTCCGIGNREVAEDALGSRSCHTGRDSLGSTTTRGQGDSCRLSRDLVTDEFVLIYYDQGQGDSCRLSVTLSPTEFVLIPLLPLNESLTSSPNAEFSYTDPLNFVEKDLKNTSAQIFQEEELGVFKSYFEAVDSTSKARHLRYSKEYYNHSKTYFQVACPNDLSVPPVSRQPSEQSTRGVDAGQRWLKEQLLCVPTCAVLLESIEALLRS
ncbi:hypothetical protein Sjap_023920 [Stephania japonica]|uniref:Uncharacterized protein n=1 Tax=Stephania japonica TaxID=461633 RepID=A0AAP0EJU9_9MAGN